jgi:hypothetical protein
LFMMPMLPTSKYPAQALSATIHNVDLFIDSSPLLQAHNDRVQIPQRT